MKPIEKDKLVKIKNIHHCRPLVIDGKYIYPGETIEISEESINEYVNHSVGKHFFDTCLIIVKDKISNVLNKVEDKLKRPGRPKKTKSNG